MLKKIISWFKPKPCECGNPNPCDSSNHKFLVLYDVVDTGPFTAKFVLNNERAMRCTKSSMLRGYNV